MKIKEIIKKRSVRMFLIIMGVHAVVSWANFILFGLKKEGVLDFITVFPIIIVHKEIIELPKWFCIMSNPFLFTIFIFMPFYVFKLRITNKQPIMGYIPWLTLKVMIVHAIITRPLLWWIHMSSYPDDCSNPSWHGWAQVLLRFPVSKLHFDKFISTIFSWFNEFYNSFLFALMVCIPIYIYKGIRRKKKGSEAEDIKILDKKKETNENNTELVK